MKKIVFLVISLVASCVAFSQVSDSCLLKGKVQIVNHFEDLKVKIVDSFEDVTVEVVSSYWDWFDCGKIELVEHFPDVKIRIVDNFEDVKIRFRDNTSKELFLKALEKTKSK